VRRILTNLFKGLTTAGPLKENKLFNTPSEKHIINKNMKTSNQNYIKPYVNLGTHRGIKCKY